MTVAPASEAVDDGEGCEGFRSCILHTVHECLQPSAESHNATGTSLVHVSK